MIKEEIAYDSKVGNNYVSVIDYLKENHKDLVENAKSDKVAFDKLKFCFMKLAQPKPNPHFIDDIIRHCDVEIPKQLYCPQCGYGTVMGIEIITDDGTKKPGYSCSLCYTAFYIEDGEVKEWK